MGAALPHLALASTLLTGQGDLRSQEMFISHIQLIAPSPFQGRSAEPFLRLLAAKLQGCRCSGDHCFLQLLSVTTPQLWRGTAALVKPPARQWHGISQDVPSQEAFQTPSRSFMRQPIPPWQAQRPSEHEGFSNRHSQH